MRKLFLLLLALTCFRFSYGEDLSPEKQQLAWKFIYDNLLSKDYLPKTFKTDIIINLKGEVTPDDSMVVKDLLKSFQKAIPHLKIELSGKPGNLVFGLNYGQKNRVTTILNDNHGISSNEMYFPDSLTSSQRKQFIYYHLFKGLTFYYWSKQPFAGLGGCVFAEKDFKSITFSPFDLFILEKLYSSDFPVLLAQNLDPGLQQTAWNSIRAKFLGENHEPVIFWSDIAIKLEGNVSLVDSTYMIELIDQLKTIIPSRKIYFTRQDANLTFNFSNLNGVSEKHKTRGNSILFHSVSIDFPKNITDWERKKILYYYLYRSLVQFVPSRVESTLVEGCVFDENKPVNITQHPFDKYILGILYANDFREQYKQKLISQNSYRYYLITTYSNEVHLFFNITALLFCIILLFYLQRKGVFHKPSVSWREFNKQGLFLILVGTIYVFILSLSGLSFSIRELYIILHFIFRAFLLINLMFLAERFLIKHLSSGSLRIIVIFIVTLFCLYIVSLPFNPTNIVFSLPKNELYLMLFIGAFLRSIYIFLNDRYKSIINQKDVELAQMGELQKQAELQSLRAKINPHFLYNALNSIASLATTDAKKTEQMALALSDFFKYAINREQKQLNSLSEELNATRTFLEIEKVRFGDRLNFEIDCNPELLDIRIPQLLIQPLVENALKHGLSQITENGMIRITISKEGTQLNIRVYDNGPAFPDGPLSGFGIQNTQERIALLYGSKATINWKNVPEKFIELSLPIVNQEFNQK